MLDRRAPNQATLMCQACGALTHLHLALQHLAAARLCTACSKPSMLRLPLGLPLLCLLPMLQRPAAQHTLRASTATLRQRGYALQPVHYYHSMPAPIDS